MIIGTGTDIVQIQRIQGVRARHGTRFAARILSADERVLMDQGPGDVFLAGRFAAKEALSKAFGTGIQRGVTWHDFSILRGNLGQPLVELKGVAAQLAAARGIQRVHLSISHERDYAIAFVILEGSG